MYEVCFYRIGLIEAVKIPSLNLNYDSKIEYHAVNTVVVEHEERLYFLMGEAVSETISAFHSSSLSLLTF